MQTHSTNFFEDSTGGLNPLSPSGYASDSSSIVLLVGKIFFCTALKLVLAPFTLPVVSCIPSEFVCDVRNLFHNN